MLSPAKLSITFVLFSTTIILVLHCVSLIEYSFFNQVDERRANTAGGPSRPLEPQITIKASAVSFNKNSSSKSFINSANRHRRDTDGTNMVMNPSGSGSYLAHIDLNGTTVLVPRIPNKLDLNAMQRRVQPIYLCNAWNDGLKWRLPERPACKFYVPEENEAVHLINITTWWPTITSQQLFGWECHAKRYYVRRSFFVYLSWSNDEKEYDHIITKEDCEKMIETHMSPNSTKLNMKGEGYYTTEETRTFYYRYATTLEWHWVDYYLIKYTIAVNSESDDIVTAAAIREPCKVQSKKCQTNLGWLLWELKDYRTCYLKKGPKALCALTGYLLTCPSLSLAFSNIRLEKMCGLKIWTSDQRGFFTPDFRQYSRDSAITEDLYPLVVKTKESRPKREALFGDEASYSSQLQYMYEVIRYNSTIMAYELNHRICLTNKMVVDTAINNAKAGNPTALVETFFGPHYRGRLDGDVLSIIKCHEIYFYKFKKSRSACMHEWPIEFSFKSDGPILTGYLTSGHEIKKSYTPTSCERSQDYYFTTGDKSYLINSESKDMRLPMLPNPALTNSELLETMPEIGFVGPAIYSASEFSDADTNHAIMQEFHKYTKIEKSLQLMKEGKTEYDTDGVLTSLRSALLAILSMLFKYLVELN